jgi:hypothetical protein
MSVYNRKLFFNRGGYAHRGTGITSGLAQPVQKFQEGGTVDPMSKARQAFYSGLMSGRSRNVGPIGSFIDVLGQASGAATQFLPDPKDSDTADETYWAYNTETKTYDRVTDKTFIAGVHTKEEPKIPDTSKDKKEFEEIDILTKDDKGGYTIPSKAYRFANLTDESINHVDLAGNQLLAENFIYAQDEEAEKSRWKLDNDFKVKMISDNSEQIITRTWDKKDNKFKFLDKDNNEIDGASFEYIDDPDKSIDARWKSERVDLVGIEDPQDTKQAIRSYNEANKNFVYESLDGTEIDMSQYREYEKPEVDKNEASKTAVEGTIKFEGQENKPANFIQDGTNVYYMSKGEAGTTVGEPILLSDLTEKYGAVVEDYQIEVPEIIESVDDMKDKIAAEQDITLKYEMVKPVLQSIIDAGIGSNKKIGEAQLYRTFIDNSTSGSWAEQRGAFMRLLDTIGYKDFDADGYGKIAEILKAGGIASTELVNAFFKNNVLLDALGWSQQLNRSELGLLFEKGPQVYLSKEGQMLLAEANIANAEIMAKASQYINDNLATTDSLVLFQEVNEIMNEEYENFLERPAIAQAIDRVNQYETLGDDKFFQNLGSVELLSGAVVNSHKAYKDGRIVFAGYPNTETGIFIDEAGNKHDFSAFPSKPIYYIIPSKDEWANSGSTGNVKAGIKQF